MISLSHFLVVGALLFTLGLVTVATRRNAVGVLMGVELILNGANVNFVAFNHYVTGGVTGQVFAPLRHRPRGGGGRGRPRHRPRHLPDLQDHRRPPRGPHAGVAMDLHANLQAVGHAAEELGRLRRARTSVVPLAHPALPARRRGHQRARRLEAAEAVRQEDRPPHRGDGDVRRLRGGAASRSGSSCTCPADERFLQNTLWNMLTAGRVTVDLAFALDPLSMMMVLDHHRIGALIHVFSIGYMADEPSYWRFFCYLNLFVFAMLLLVMGDNFAVMFFGWEGVGLATYLLIALLVHGPREGARPA